MNQTKETRVPLKHLALAMVLGLGVGSAAAQTILEVGGDGVIGDEALTTNALPVSGATFTTDGGTGTVFSDLVSPTVEVPTTGAVTLKFTHRYFFEPAWDGGAVYVSVNGAPPTQVLAPAFTANGYVGDTTGNPSSSWPDGVQLFYGKSTDYDIPDFIESVANLGTLTAGDEISVVFRGGWDAGYVEPDTNWEITTVVLEDSGATPFLDTDFAAGGTSGFTVENTGNVAGPWTYLKPVSTFELDADLDTADRYTPPTPGGVIDLADAALAVEVLNGAPDVGDTFTLFDLSGGTTLTGTYSSLTMPPGIWDVSNLTVDGTITFQVPPSLTTPGADFEVNAKFDTDGDEYWEDLVAGNPSGLGLLIDDSPAVTRVATSGTSTQLSHAYEFPGGSINNEAGALLVTADTTTVASFQNGPGDWSNDSVTMEVWFKPDNLMPTPDNGQIIFEDGGGTGLGIFIDANELVLGHDSNVNLITYSLATDPSGLLLGPATDEFIQVVVTHDTANAFESQMFVNGTLVGTSNNNNDWSGGDAAGFGTRGAANVGGRGGGQNSTESFDGQIALIRVYNQQILTATEVMNNFDEISGPDLVPPAISDLLPANNTPDAFAGANLSATFFEDINLKTGGTITIRNIDTSSDTVITLPDDQVSSNGNDLVIDLDTDLAFDTNYAILISPDAVEDLATTPNPFAGITTESTWRFKTLAADATPPVVTDLSPAGDSTDITPIADLVATFDEDVVAGTGNVLIKDLSAMTTTSIGITDASQVSIVGNVLTVNPTAPLSGGADYAIQIEDGALVNLTGIAFPGITDDMAWSFSTLGETSFVTDNGQWSNDGSWDPAVPAPGVNATIGAGLTAISSQTVPEWGGTLTLEAGSRLSIRDNTAPGDLRNPLQDATTVFMNGGAIIGDSFRSLEEITADFVLDGGGGFQQDSGTSGWNRDRRFRGVFSGTGPLTIDAENHMGYGFYSANTFTGGLVIDSGNRYGVGFYAAGAAGAGDVTVNAGNNADMRSGVLFVRANDVFAPSCVLTLNGLGWNNSTGGFGPYAGNSGQVGTQVRIIMDGFNSTVDKLFIDDVQQEAGDYTSADGDWIDGSGTLTVLNGPITEYGSWAALYAPADLADPNADLDGDGLINDYERIFGLDPTDALSANPIAVPLDPTAGTFSFTRRDDALSGLFSGVETSTDLVMWTEDAGATLTPGAPDANNIETVAVTLSPGLLAAPKLFVRAVQDDGLLFASNFETDNGGFTVETSAGSDWQFGAPTSLGLGGEVLSGNGGSTNCWGTDIGDPGEYIVPTTTKLRSPVIDLTGVTAAQLTFAQAMDLELGDTAVVNIIEEATGTVIAGGAAIYTATDADINTSDWEAVAPIDLAAGVGMKVRIEWAFTGGTAEYLGWYIDDVTVSKAAP